MAPGNRPHPPRRASSASNHLAHSSVFALLCWDSFTQSIVSLSLCRITRWGGRLYIELRQYGMAGGQYAFTRAIRCNDFAPPLTGTHLFSSSLHFFIICVCVCCLHWSVAPPPLLLFWFLLFDFFHPSTRSNNRTQTHNHKPAFVSHSRVQCIVCVPLDDRLATYTTLYISRFVPRARSWIYTHNL